MLHVGEAVSLTTVREHTIVAREALEAVLLRLDARGARADVLAALREALTALSRLSTLDLDHPEALAEVESARASIGKLKAALTQWAPSAEDDAASNDAETVDECAEVIGQIRATLANRAVSAGPAPRFEDAPARNAIGFSASVGTAALFDGVDVPSPDVLPLDERWAAYEDPARDRRPGVAPGAATGAAPERAPEAAHLEMLARDLMEDLATLASLRRATGIEPWGESEPFEERLLASLDALVSLARPVREEQATFPLVDRLYRYATEWWVPDGGRSFAFAFTLACLRSETAMRWVVLGAQRAPAGALHAFASALSLGSSPGADGAITALLGTDVPAMLTLALEVARRRRYFQMSLLPFVAHPDRAVAEAALRTLPGAPRATALDVLGGVLAGAGARGGGAYLSAVAAELLATMGDPQAIPACRQLVGEACAAGDFATATVALRTIAVNGDRRDADLVLQAALQIPDGLYLLGFFGAPEHALAVVDALRNPERVADAERGLRRLTGFTFDPPFEVDALSKTVASRLKDWSGRIRFGAPHTGRAVMDELSNPQTAQLDRRVLAIEAGILAREPLRVDLDGWVARQRAEVDLFRESISSPR